MEWFNQISTYTPPEDEGIVASIPDVAPLVNLYEGDEYCGMEVYEEDTVSAQDVKRLKAKKFVELIMQGKTPTKAAEEVNEQLSRYQTKEEVVLAIKKVIENWTFPAEVRRLYSRALTTKIAAEQSLNSDPKAAKVALEALKMMAQDEEVNWLNTKTQGPTQAGPQLPESLLKLLGGGEKEEVVDGDVSEE